VRLRFLAPENGDAGIGVRCYNTARLFLREQRRWSVVCVPLNCTGVLGLEEICRSRPFAGRSLHGSLAWEHDEGGLVRTLIRCFGGLQSRIRRNSFCSKHLYELAGVTEIPSQLSATQGFMVILSN